MVTEAMAPNVYVLITVIGFISVAAILALLVVLLHERSQDKKRIEILRNSLRMASTEIQEVTDALRTSKSMAFQIKHTPTTIEYQQPSEEVAKEVS